MSSEVVSGTSGNCAAPVTIPSLTGYMLPSSPSWKSEATLLDTASRGRNNSFEPVRIFTRSNADHAKEGATHGVGSPKATCIRDLLQPHRGAVDHLLRCFHAH